MRLPITILVTCGLAIAAQPQESKPVFEVASIKPSRTVGTDSTFNTTPGRLTATNWTLRDYIRICYDIRIDSHVVGGPKWIDENRYDIVATMAESGAAAPEERQREPERINAALRNLLADRFHLVLHRESKAVTGYALTVAKNGPKLKESAPETRNSNRWINGKLTSTGVSMSKLAEVLTRIIGSPVVDYTSISGIYDLVLEWAPERARETSDKPDIFAAVQQQLGLKLESQKVEQQILVIDRAELPEGN